MDWLTLKDEFVANYKIFDLHKVHRKSSISSKEGNFYVLDSASWVNLIPITKDGEIILIEQFRHGTAEVTLEIPGGLVEQGEDPRLAAERECKEETGYFSTTDSVLLCEISPNPAFLNNRCYSYIWLDVEQKFEQSLDGNEEIRIISAKVDQVFDYIKSGRIDHSLVLNAFFFYLLKFGRF